MNDQAESCPVCGYVHVAPWMRDNGYTIFRCARCDLGFVSPIPDDEELTRHYNEAYAVNFIRYRNNVSTRRVEELEEWHQPRGRLLEIGCSYGYELALARDRGWEVIGTEVAADAADHARQELGLDVVTGKVDDFRSDDMFDAVVMWHVLEHVPDPLSELQRVADLIRVGGTLGIRVPNGRSLWIRFAGRDWSWVCPPTHLWYFTAESLIAVLRASGFEPISSSSAQGDGLDPLVQVGHIALRKLRRISQRLKPAHLPHESRGLPSTTRQNSQRSLPSRPASAARSWELAVSPLGPLSRLISNFLAARGWADELVVYARRVEPVVDAPAERRAV
jgi:2-polyprenyl-3-methyl-5-hydroxy-6-metoxy-1,4-benzoquinol methylase